MKTQHLLAVAAAAAFALCALVPGTPAWAESAEDASLAETIAITETETDTATEEEIAQALAEGVEGMASTADSADDTADESGNSETEEELSSMSVLELLSTTSRTIKLESYAGDTRYETAVAVAEAAYPSGVSSKTAIIVSGESSAWPDSLSSSSLAGLIDCPILYAKKSSLPSATEEALEELGVTNVIIVGGTSVVGTAVEEDLKDLGLTVTRLAGETRYETQLAVYEYGATVGTWSTNIIVASGTSYADALSVSPVAFGQKMAIFLAAPGELLSAAQVSALVENGAETYTIVGGTSAVTSNMEGFLIGLNSATTSTYSSSAVERISGSNRYATSWKIAVWAVGEGYLSWDYTGLASGTTSVDALCGSVLQGKTGAPILLITNSELDLVESLAAKSPAHARVFGGTGTISQVSRNEIAMTLGYKLSQIQGFKVYLDAGHGQNNTGNGTYDGGATSGSYVEAELTAELAGLVAELLRADGYEVFLNDDGGPYKYRHAEAVAQDCNVIISIHFNAGGGTGSMTLIHNTSAQEYSSYVANIMQSYLVAGTSLKNLGVREQQVTILSGELPACLLEVCFIDRSSDMSTYTSRKSTVAAQIAAGIENI